MSQFPYAGSPPSAAELDKEIDRCRQLAAAGQLEQAIGHCRRLAAALPKQPRPLETLAQLLRQAGQAREAVAPLRALVALDGRNHLRHTDLASLYHELNDLPNAERHARQAMALNPFNAQAHNLLGMIHLKIQHPEEAEFHFRELLLLHEPLSPISANLASAYKIMGRLDEAETFFRYCTRLDPANIDGWIGWARMEEARRDIPRARELLEKAEAVNADHPAVAITRSVLLRREQRYEEALDALDARERSDMLAQPAYQYERGEVLDRLGRYDAAFASFAIANRLVIESGRGQYEADKQAATVDKLKAFFVRDRIAPIVENLAPESSLGDMPKPIFIVGFPRSGTTLTEQILGSHPAISPGDELDYISRLTRLATHMTGAQSPYPECLAELANPGKSDAINKFRGYYIFNAELRRIIEKGTRRFTDKMPLNEVNLGLIHLVFPGAPIVHLLRHPLDVVLSTFFNDLTHGGNCSYQLESAARHYALVFDLIQHYRRELDLNYLAVRYEDIVEEPERYTRELLAFVDEPFDERCLEFHNNQRYARTASYAQVTEKLYKRSRFRYRNYLDQLAPVIPILQPAIEHLGYEL